MGKFRGTKDSVRANARWWIVEHPSRGVLIEFTMDGPKFSWSILRTEGWLFGSKAEAEKALAKIPDNIRSKCFVYGPLAR